MVTNEMMEEIERKLQKYENDPYYIDDLDDLRHKKVLNMLANNAQDPNKAVHNVFKDIIP